MMIKMKKNYSTPNTEVIEIDFENALLAGTNGFNDGDAAPIGDEELVED